MWNSVRPTDANKLERIQRKFALSYKFFFSPFKPIIDSYVTAVQYLKLHALRERRHHLHTSLFVCLSSVFRGPGSSVGIVTDYGLDGPGIESRWGEIFHRPDRPWGPPSLLYNGYRVFLGDRKRPGRDADPSPPSSAEV